MPSVGRYPRDVRSLEDLTTSWRRLWLQVGDPAFTVEPPLLQRELAKIWAQIDALTHLGQGMDPVARKMELELCALAVRSLADPDVFDGGHWQTARLRAESAAREPVPAVELPVLPPVTATPQGLLAEVLARVSPGRGGVVEPVLDVGLKAERSRPGWLLSGLSRVNAPDQGATHLGVFAIDEGDNEVLAIVPVYRVGPHIELTDDDVITGLHERAKLADRLTIATLVGVLSAGESPAGGAERLELALARASARSAMLSLDQPALTVRAKAVSAAVVCVAAVLDPGESGQDTDWHLTRLVALL